MLADPAAKTRLNSWKEVAAFFGKAERTVMRWESERGLPVHRLPGEAGSSVYADIAELQAWLRGPAATAVPAIRTDLVTAEARPAASRLQKRLFAAGIASILCLVLATVMVRSVPRASAPPAPAAKALYIRALQDWAERNPPALNRAVEGFSAALQIDAGYAEAYVGLANSYILLREFAVMPSGQAYDLAKAAATRAIALKPALAGAHAALGFALLYGEWRFGEGLAEFEQALRLEPDNPGLQHWYATALMAVGHHNAALAHIERALELSPGAHEIQADRGVILFSQGRYAEARALLTRLAADNPDFLSPHAYLALVALFTGDDETYLREEAMRARLLRDAQGIAMARVVQAGYNAGGHAGMLHALIQARLAALADGTGSASSIAWAYAAAGDGKHTLTYLGRALDRRDDNAFSVINNTVFCNLLGDTALAKLRARLALPAPN